MEESDLQFPNFEPGNPNLRLTHEEIAAIAENLPKGQEIIHCALRSSVRFNRKDIPGCFTVLSNHFILCIQNKSAKTNKDGEEESNKGSAKFAVLARVHICDIQMLAYSKDKEVLIQSRTVNLRLLDDGFQLNRKFMQILYRNFQIIYSAYDKISSALELRADDMSFFPDINIYISPSQKFQFLYYALCSKCGTIFHQDVVRFIHTMVLSGMSIVDLSQLPIDQYGQEQEGYDLKPIFRALSMMKFVCGVCCSGTERPTIMEEVQALLEYSQKLQIIHIANCGATSGLNELLQAAKKKEGLPIQYWNISGNNFEDFSAFVSLLEVAKDPLLFVDISNCGVTADSAKAIFRAFKGNKNLHSVQQLHIAGIEMDDEAFEAFDAYLATLTKRTIAEPTFKIPLRSLNIGGTPNGLDKFLGSLNKSPIPLTSLIISDSNVDQLASDSLIAFIKASTTLRCLDMSGTKISAENVSDIVGAISKNPKLHHFDLRINRLDLKTGNLLPMFRVFLSGNLKRWYALSLDGNEMDQDDLRNILPLLTLMKKLRYLSLNDNFDDSMKNIENILPKILDIPSLRSLSIACKSSEHKLRAKLIPMIVELRKHKNIAEIDISGNSIGDDGISAVIHYLRSNKDCESISIDGSEPKSLDLLSELSSLIKKEDQKKLTSLDFPAKDAALMLKQLSGPQLKEAVQRMSNIQLSMVNSISVHRAQLGIAGKLPFEATREIKDLINSISTNTRQGFLANERPLEHSYICDEFGLPLPYQKIGDLVSDGGQVIDREVEDELQVYATPDFYKYVEEEKSHYVITENSLALSEISDDKITSAESSSVALASSYSINKRKQLLQAKNNEKPKDDNKKPGSTKNPADEEVHHSEKKLQKKKKNVQNNEPSSSDSTEDEVNSPNKVNRRVGMRKDKLKKKKFDSNDDSSEELPPKVIRKKSRRNIDSDDDENEAPKKPKRSNKISHSESSSDDENERPIKRKSRKFNADSDSSSDDDRPTKRAQQKKRLPNKRAPKPVDSSSSDDDDEEEVQKKKQPNKRQTSLNERKPSKRKFPSSSSEDENIEPLPEKLQNRKGSTDLKRKPSKKPFVPPSSSSSDFDEDDKPIMKRKPSKKQVANSPSSDSDEDDRPKLNRKPSKKRAVPPSSSSSDFDEDNKPVMKRKPSKKQVTNSPSSDSDEDDRPRMKRKPTKKQAIPSNSSSEEERPRRSSKKKHVIVSDDSSDSGSELLAGLQKKKQSKRKDSSDSFESRPPPVPEEDRPWQKKNKNRK